MQMTLDIPHLLTKVCSKCGTEKPTDEFSGRRNVCKRCHTEYMVQYYWAQTDEWRRNVCEGVKRNRLNNIEYYREKDRTRKRPEGFYLRMLRNRRARRRAAICEHGTGCFARAAATMPRKCANCGSTSREICADHIVSLTHGGKDCKDNLQPLCRQCNASKGIRDPD